MAEIQFRVETDWQEVQRLVHEIDALQQSLQSVNTGLPSAEIEKLNNKLTDLKEKYSEVIAFANRANADLSDIFGKRGGIGGAEGELSKGISSEMEKVQQAVNETFSSMLSKVEEFTTSVNSAFKMVSDIKNVVPSSDIVNELVDKTSELTAASEKQQLIIQDQSTQQERIIMQRQQETSSVITQANEVQGLTEEARTRVDIEGDVGDAIDKNTSAFDKQTEAVKNNTNAIKENKEASESGGNYLENAQKELAEQKDKLAGLYDKAGQLPLGSKELEEVEKEIEETKRKINDLSETIARMVDPLKFYEEEVDKINEKIAGVKEKLNNTDPESSEYAAYTKELKTYEEQLEVATRRVETLREAERKAAEEREANRVKTFRVNAKDENGTNYGNFNVLGKNVAEVKSEVEKAIYDLKAIPSIIKRIEDESKKLKDNPFLSEKDREFLNEVPSQLGKVESGLEKLGDNKLFNQKGENVVSGYTDQLDKVEEELVKITQRAKETQEAFEKKTPTERLRTQIMNAREEMAKLIAEEKKGTPEFAALAEKAGDMRDNMQKASATLNYYADNQRGLHALKTGLQGVAGAASLATGVMGLFNEDSEKMAKIQTQIQSIMGVVVGLEMTYNLFKKESMFRLAAENVLTWLNVKAKVALAWATRSATLEQEKLNAAMVKNPYGAILAVIVTVIAAMYALYKALDKETEAEKKAQEQRKKAREEQKQLFDSWKSAAASSEASQIRTYRNLQKEWKKLGGDLKKQKQYIKDNEQAFHDLGWAVKTVTDVENLLVNNTDAVVSAIKARAKAAAYEQVWQEQYKKEVEKRLQEDKEGMSVKNGGSVRTVKAGDENYYKSDAFKNAQKAGYTAEKGDFDGAKLTEKGVKRVMEYNKKYAAGLRLLYNQRVAERRKAADKELDIIDKSLEKELKEEELFRKKTGVQEYNPHKTDKKGNSDKEENDFYKRRAQMIEDELKYQDEIEKIRRDAERARIDAEIAQIKDDGERERKTREEQHRRNLEDIELQQDEIYKKIYEKHKAEYEEKRDKKKNKIPFELTIEGMEGWRGVKDKAKQYLSQQDVRKENAIGLREIGFTDEQIENIKSGKVAVNDITKAFDMMRSVSDDGFKEIKNNINDITKQPKEIGVKVKTDEVKSVLTLLSTAFPNQREEVIKIVTESKDIDDVMHKLQMFVGFLQRDTITSIQNAQRALLTKAGKGNIIEQLDKMFGNGNVDVVARPMIDAAKLVEKGWEDAGDGIYSIQRQVMDAQGNTHEVLFTPILPDGSVLSPQEFEKYIANALNGAEDILQSDKKGIVIGIDVSDDGSAGQKLHELQEELIDVEKEVSDKIQNMYSKTGGNNNFDEKDKAMLNAQQRITNANKDKETSDHQRDINKELKERLAALYEYESKYGSFEERRAAITAKYDQQIAETKDAIQKASLERQKEEDIKALNMDALKSELDWETVFGDLSMYSTKSLVKLKEKLRTALDAKDITAENAKVISDKILEIEDKIGSRSNILESIIPGLKEHNRLVERKVEAEKEYNRLLKEEQERVATMNSKGDVAVQALKKVGVKNDKGKDFDFDEIFQMPQSNFNDLITKLRSMGDEGNAAADKLEDFKTATINATEATEKSTKAKEHKDNLSKLVEGKTTFKDFMTAASGGGGSFGYAQMALKNGESMKELVDTIGLSNTEFGEAVGDFSEGCQGFSQAIQALMSGDVIGAVTGIVKGFQGYGKVIEKAFGFSFSGSNEEEHDRIDAELTRSNEHLKNSIDKLKESFDNYNGAKAIETSDEINKKQEEYNNNLLKKWANDMNYHSAHHSNAYYWEFDQWAQDDFNRTLANMGSDKRVNGSWESLMTLSPEEMEKIRDENAEAWEYITSRGKYSWAYDNLNEYANQAHKIEEQTKALYENLAQTTEQNVFEDALNDLYDFGDGVDDVANNIEKRWAQMKNHMVIKNLVSQGMEEDLKKWYNDLAKLQKEATEAKKAGTFNAVEYNRRMKELKDRYDEIYQEKQEQIKEYQDAGIIQDLDKLNYEQQSALGNSIENISYDQADSLIGIMTSQQILMEQIKTILDEWSRRSALNELTADDTTQTAETIANAVNNAVAFGLPIVVNLDAEELAQAFTTALNNVNSTDVATANDQAMNGVLDVLQGMEVGIVRNTDLIRNYERMMMANLIDVFSTNKDDNTIMPTFSIADELMAMLRDSKESNVTDNGESFLDVYGENLVNVVIDQRNISADSRDILAAMSFHVEEIRDGVVESIVPNIKEMTEEMSKLRKKMEDM